MKPQDEGMKPEQEGVGSGEETTQTPSRSSAVIGFLDGYRAGNLAVARPKLTFRINSIQRICGKINDVLSAESLSLMQEEWIRGCELLSQYEQDEFNTLIQFGQAVHAWLDMNQDYVQIEEIGELIKQLAYHYRYISSELDDRDIAELSRRIDDAIQDKN